MKKRKYGDPVPEQLINKASETILTMFDISEELAKQCANDVLNTYESKGGWVEEINEEIKEIIKVVVSKWLEQGYYSQDL